MRCKNCGWPNQPGETTCSKCHAPLEAETVVNDVVMQQPPINEGANLRKTVLEPVAVGQEKAQGRTCEQCGYPLKEGSTKCPKCGTPVQAAMPRRATVLNPVMDNAEKTVRQEPVALGHNAFKNIKSSDMKTINPYIDGFAPVPACSLKPFKRSNENKKLENIEFEGSEIILKRENTDADNATISNENQAVITNENGKWYIEDQSDAKTTFVRAGEKIEIKDGSIILLGNRLFEFHA